MASGYFSKLRHKILQTTRSASAVAKPALRGSRLAICSKKSERQRFSVTSNESDGPTPHLTKVRVIKKFPSINNY